MGGACTRSPDMVHKRPVAHTLVHMLLCRHLCAHGRSPHCADRDRVAVLEALYSWAEPALRIQGVELI